MAAPDIDEVLEAVERDDLIGFCGSCGAEHMNIEPDLRNGTCESCGVHAVKGAQEWLLEMVP